MTRPDPLDYRGIPDTYVEDLEIYCNWLELKSAQVKKCFEEEIKTKTHWGQREVLRAFNDAIKKGEQDE